MRLCGQIAAMCPTAFNGANSHKCCTPRRKLHCPSDYQPRSRQYETIIREQSLSHIANSCNAGPLFLLAHQNRQLTGTAALALDLWPAEHSKLLLSQAPAWPCHTYYHTTHTLGPSTAGPQVEANSWWSLHTHPCCHLHQATCFNAATGSSTKHASSSCSFSWTT